MVNWYLVLKPNIGVMSSGIFEAISPNIMGLRTDPTSKDGSFLLTTDILLVFVTICRVFDKTDSAIQTVKH